MHSSGSELAAGTAASGLLHPYPFYLASPLERPAPGARAARPVARGVEVGRHPRADRAARRGVRAVVAWRGAHHRPFSGDHRCCAHAAFGHRARRRGDVLARRCPAAFCDPAEAHRAQDAGSRHPRRGARALPCLRPAGKGRCRPACGPTASPTRCAARTAARSAAGDRHLAAAPAGHLGGPRRLCATPRARSASRA